MCGIIGYIGARPIVEVILSGLRKLEYRGYDSAGIALVNNHEFTIRRSTGKLVNLEQMVHRETLDGSVGIGHTRWATHGKPSVNNAHPHVDGAIAVVHNGIIENYLELKKELMQLGHTFQSDTDTEIVAHLINQAMLDGESFEEAVRKAVLKVAGSFALGVINKHQPDLMIAVRRNSPLILGIGEHENFIASDVPAIISYTKKVVFLEDNEIAYVGRESYKIHKLSGEIAHNPEVNIPWNPVMAEKGGHKHFMLKEIHEQHTAIINTIQGRISSGMNEIFLEELPDGLLKGIEKIVILACGTSWHAGLVGKFMIEELVRLPVEVDYSSEFRYRDPIVSATTLIIPISQSGETADTLAAMREAKLRGAKVISICNVMKSSVARESDYTIYTHAGPEIGVASTKAFTSQIIVLYLFALYLAQYRQVLPREILEKHIQDLRLLPHAIDETLRQSDHIKGIARNYMQSRNFLYLGRGINYPIALEGALKLKEISYIHAEGYPAGEMKHGPIALIDEHLPTMMLIPRDKNYEKVINNLEEIKARSGRVIAIVSEDDEAIRGKVTDWIEIPRVNPFLTTILLTIPLQLFAYFVADMKGTDVDQPRNLAKSVTVE
jgi:glucosamine--fructose-6-phosphate aminotransferase (isomerizing)